MHIIWVTEKLTNWDNYEIYVVYNGYECFVHIGCKQWVFKNGVSDEEHVNEYWGSRTRTSGSHLVHQIP